MASLALVILVAACGSSTPSAASSATVGASAAAPSAVASTTGASLPPSESPSVAPSASPTDTPTPTPGPTPAPCTSADLAARVVQWGGAMGNRIADVQLTNKGQATCALSTTNRPQLVDGAGNVLIDGTAPASSATIPLAAGSVAKTQVNTSNYCGPAPVAPVSLAFVLPGSLGRLVATPVSATSTDGAAPCMGNPGDPGSISMHAWAP
jgi:hypothetical protein